MPTQHDQQLVEKLGDSLAGAFTGAAQRAVEYLSLTNGGGVIGCLTVIATDSSRFKSAAPVWLLIVFLLGLACVGFTVISDFFRGRGVLISFIEARTEFSQDRATVQDVVGALKLPRARTFMHVNGWLGLASFILFWVGAIGSCVWLYCSSR